MKYWIATILVLIFYHHPSSALASKYSAIFPVVTTVTDTLVPPPPGPLVLEGPATACPGETTTFIVEVPLGCTCQWAVNGNIQSETGPVFAVTWSQTGLQIVTLSFICNGQNTPPDSAEVTVLGTPEPSPIEGETQVCEYTYHTYSTEVGPYDSCQWTVNGEIQPGYEPELTYSFGEAGSYLFEVIAFNKCGTSSPQTLQVAAQGTAPEAPSPIEGPGESCEGYTDTYTTTVGPGESCAWWIDGELQGSDSTTLIVTWEERGYHLIEVRAVSGCGTGNPTVRDVSVLYHPDVFLGNDTAIMQGHTLMLDAGNSGSDYLWSTGETTQTIEVSTSGTYSVQVTNICGEDADTIVVSVYTGIGEEPAGSPCFSVLTSGNNLTLQDFRPGMERVQIAELTGKIIYNGPAEMTEISLRPGMYLIKAGSYQSTCTKKVFIP